MKLRGYQADVCAKVRDTWSSGVRSVLVVSPTGSGKTVIGSELASSGNVLWLAHRVELVDQTVTRLRCDLGRENVGVITGVRRENLTARVVVGTVQSVANKHFRPDLVVLDEAHHYAADVWFSSVRRIRAPRVLGLTATPERADGKPLGDIFGHMVVAASYSQLIRERHIVRARVIAPVDDIGRALAIDAVDACDRYATGKRTIVFCESVDVARDACDRSSKQGTASRVIDWETPAKDRVSALAAFVNGTVMRLFNVNVLTEGVDVPCAEAVVLARTIGHVGGYLQAVGRVLRPSKDKSNAIVVDLVGACAKYGMPTEDREYFLQGKAIRPGVPGGALCVERGERLDLEVVNADMRDVTSDVDWWRRRYRARDVRGGGNATLPWSDGWLSADGAMRAAGVSMSSACFRKKLRQLQEARPDDVVFRRPGARWIEVNPLMVGDIRDWMARKPAHTEERAS